MRRRLGGSCYSKGGDETEAAPGPGELIAEALALQECGAPVAGVLYLRARSPTSVT